MESAQSPTTSISPQSGNFNNPSEIPAPMSPHSGNSNIPSELPAPMSPQSGISDGTTFDINTNTAFPTEAIKAIMQLQNYNPKIEELHRERSLPGKQADHAFKPPRGMDPHVFKEFWSDRDCGFCEAPSETDNPPRGMNPDLLSAARSGDLERLEKFLKPVPCVLSEITAGGETVLHIAARKGHQKFVEKLLDLPGDEIGGGKKWQFVRAKDREGNTALHVAAIAGNATIVETLVQKYGHLALETNKLGETALFKAAEEGHAEAFKKLLAITSEGKMKRILDGQTPLHRAFLKPNKDIFQEIIDHRSNLLREKDNYGMTPLHIASFTVIPVSPPPIWFFRARKRHSDISQIFEMLIKKDSSVCYMVDKNKQNPLHLAVINGNAGLVRQILHHSKDCLDMIDIVGRNPLHLAVENASIIFARAGPGIRDIMLDVLKKRLINSTDYFGRTPIDIVKDYSSKDPRLFYAIGNFLSKCGGRPSSRWLQSEARNFPTSEMSIWKGQTISVNAVLLATVAFTVAFTLPREDDSPDMKSPIFKVLVVSDALAFCFSMASELVLVYASFSSKVEDPILCDMSLFALGVALLSTGITFGAAIHIVVAPKCLWLAMLVWAMVSYLPIWLVRLSSRGKLFLFTHPTAFIVDLLSAAVSLLYFLCDPLHELVTVLVDVIGFVRFSLRRCVKGKSPIISSKRSYSSSAMESCTDFLSKKV